MRQPEAAGMLGKLFLAALDGSVKEREPAGAVLSLTILSVESMGLASVATASTVSALLVFASK